MSQTSPPNRITVSHMRRIDVSILISFGSLACNRIYAECLLVDAQEAGRIVTDLTHLLKDEQSVPRSPEGTIQGDAYYRIEYNIVPFVKGRNLLYHSVYPADASGTVQATGQISIAAAFRPGTG